MSSTSEPPREQHDGRPDDATDTATAGPDSGGPVWEPDGVNLAKALVARAKAAGRNGGAPSRRRTKPNPRTSGRARRAPGAGWSGPGGDDRDPQALATAVDKLVGEHGWDEDLAVHGVVARWDHVVGDEVAAHVTPEQYADGVLCVRADSTAWATQVRMLAPQLVRRLNEEIGQGAVQRVTVLGPQSPTWRKGPRSVPGRGPRDTYG